VATDCEPSEFSAGRPAGRSWRPVGQSTDRIRLPATNRSSRGGSQRARGLGNRNFRLGRAHAGRHSKTLRPFDRFMESPLGLTTVHWDHEPLAVPRRTKSADKSDALQTLRARGRVSGPRGSVWSACVFSAAFPRQAAIRWPGRFMESPLAISCAHRIIGLLRNGLRFNPLNPDIPHLGAGCPHPALC